MMRTPWLPLLNVGTHLSTAQGTSTLSFCARPLPIVFDRNAGPTANATPTLPKLAHCSNETSARPETATGPRWGPRRMLRWACPAGGLRYSSYQNAEKGTPLHPRSDCIAAAGAGRHGRHDDASSHRRISGRHDPNAEALAGVPGHQ